MGQSSPRKIDQSGPRGKHGNLAACCWSSGICLSVTSLCAHLYSNVVFADRKRSGLSTASVHARDASIGRSLGYRPVAMGMEPHDPVDPGAHRGGTGAGRQTAADDARQERADGGVSRLRRGARRHRPGIRHEAQRALSVLFASADPLGASRRGWTPEAIAEHALPALQSSFMPLDTSGDFSPGTRCNRQITSKMRPLIWSRLGGALPPCRAPHGRNGAVALALLFFFRPPGHRPAVNRMAGFRRIPAADLRRSSGQSAPQSRPSGQGKRAPLRELSSHPRLNPSQ